MLLRESIPKLWYKNNLLCSLFKDKCLMSVLNYMFAANYSKEYHFKYINIWQSRCGFTKPFPPMMHRGFQSTTEKVSPTPDHQSFKGILPRHACDYYDIFQRTILVSLFFPWFFSCPSSSRPTLVTCHCSGILTVLDSIEEHLQIQFLFQIHSKFQSTFPAID